MNRNGNKLPFYMDEDLRRLQKLLTADPSNNAAAVELAHAMSLFDSVGVTFYNYMGRPDSAACGVSWRRHYPSAGTLGLALLAALKMETDR